MAMTVVQLENVTGHSRVDECLRAFIALIEAVFPRRIRAYYLLGSYADGNAVLTSDIDLCAISIDHFHPDEHQLYQIIARQCSVLAGVLFDTGIFAEADLGGKPVLATSRLFLYGEDIGYRIPPVQRVDIVRKAVSAALYMLCELYAQEPPLQIPLGYPDPLEEFYGYASQGIAPPGGRNNPGIKKFINAVSMAAGALVCLKSEHVVLRRADCVAFYRSHIHDEWSDFVTEVCALRTQLNGYAVPESPLAQQRLRGLCARLPDSANHFLSTCTSYLLVQLKGPDEVQRCWATEQLAIIGFPERHILKLDEQLDVAETLP